MTYTISPKQNFFGEVHTIHIFRSLQKTVRRLTLDILTRNVGVYRMLSFCVTNFGVKSSNDSHSLTHNQLIKVKNMGTPGYKATKNMGTLFMADDLCHIIYVYVN